MKFVLSVAAAVALLAATAGTANAFHGPAAQAFRNAGNRQAFRQAQRLNNHHHGRQAILLVPVAPPVQTFVAPSGAILQFRSY
jgi:hypothetical protein